MRISLVTETFLPQINGVAKTVAALKHHLVLLGHDVQLVRPRQGHDDYSRKDQGLDEFITFGPSSTSILNIPISAPATFSLFRLWSLRKPDLVHIATEGPLGLSALTVARKLGIPVTSDFRTNTHLYVHHHGLSWISRPLLSYLRFFHNRTSMTTVPTEGLLAFLSSNGFKNLMILGRGVDSELFNPANRSDFLRTSWGARDDDFVLLFVGRLIPEKNLSLLVKAYQALLMIDKRIKLVIVGDGPDRRYLNDEAPSAILCGNLTGIALTQHYASSDLLLFPSRTDTFGNVVIEALASAVPVMAFNDAAASIYIKNFANGYLCDGVDQAFLAGVVAMHYLFRSDRAQYDDIRQAARQTTLSQGWPSIAQQFATMASGVIDSNS